MNTKAVKIKIKDSRKILAIQNEFSKVFPYLKLEFFSKPHQVKGGSLKKYMKPIETTIGQCRTVHNPGEIIITPSMTVAELEQGISSMYGLNIQVFRKSGKIWLETTVTDGWTLEEQNKQGEALSK